MRQKEGGGGGGGGLRMREWGGRQGWLVGCSGGLGAGGREFGVCWRVG